MYRISHQARPLTFVVFLLLALLLFSGGTQIFAQSGDQGRAEIPIDKSRADTIELMAAIEADQGNQSLMTEAVGVTPCVAGMAGSYPCDKVDLMAFMPLGTFSAGSSNDIWGWTDPQDGDEYALLGLNNGTAFVDITDPENPVYLGKLPTHSTSSTWRDIKVYNNYAFIVSEASNHGMQIFDLTQLRNVVGPPVTFSNTAHYNEFSDAHNIVINEDSGYAYGVGTNTCSGGLHMIDISDPLNPANVGCFSGDGYTHDAQCVNYAGPDPDYAGGEICFNSNTDTLTIVDVTDKGNPTEISRTGYSGVGYTHQGWLLEDQRYFLLGDEQDETDFGHNTYTYMWDLIDLDNPVLMGHYTGPNASIDHNMYIVGDYVFQSNYSSGLQILDNSDVANGNLSMYGFFDTYPNNNNANFSGSWSNYPYFDSGMVVVSDGGLFIVYPYLAPDFAMDAGSASLSICGDGNDSLTIDLTARNGYTGTVTLSSESLPAGASSGFSTNPVNPPANSDLTVTTSAVGAGDYPFKVVGTDSTITHTVDLNLHVDSASPGTAVLSSPANGAVDVDYLPTLSWTAVAQATSYYLEVATDAGFSNIVYSATESSTSHDLTTALDSETTYYWHVQADNVCGSGSFSTPYNFTTRFIPQVLLVDDDDNGPDVRSYYTDALDGLGLDYDVWDTGNSDDEPTQSLMSPYSVIIWFTGDEFDQNAGPSSTSESYLGGWLDNSNCFFISSQDYLHNRGETAFMTSYLGVNATGDDSGNYVSLTGQGSLFGGLGSLPLDFPFTDFADEVSPDGTAELAFVGDNGRDGAVNKDSGVYKTVYFGFPFEAISGEGARMTVMATVADWCGLEVVIPPSGGSSTYLPMVIGDGGGAAVPPAPQAGLFWLLPLVGITFVVGFGRNWRSRTK